MLTFKSLFKPRSLLDRVYILYAAALLVVAGIGTLQFIRQQYTQQKSDTLDMGTMVVELAAQSIGDAAVVNDHDAIRRTLASAVLHTPFGKASYDDLRGQVLTESSNPQPETWTPAWIRSLVARDMEDVNRVISVGGRDYGVLRLHYVHQQIAEQRWALLRDSIAMLVVVLAAGLVLIRVLLTRWLSDVDRIQNFAEDIRLGRFEGYEDAARDAPPELRKALELFGSAASGLRTQFDQRLDALSFALMQHKNATDQAVIVLELDPLGFVTAVNDLFCMTSGWTRAKVVGQRFDHFIAPDSRVGEQSPMLTQQVWRGELECLAFDHSRYWVQRIIVPILSGEQRIEKFICLDIDITLQKRAEQTLQEQKERAEVTLHSIADGVLSTDARGMVIYANAAAERVLHKPMREILGWPLTRILPLDGQLLSLPQGGRGRGEVALKDGSLAVLEWSFSPLRGGEGGRVLAFRDVSREHRLQVQLRRLSEAVEHAASGVLITNREGTIEYVNPKFTEMTGYSATEVIGSSPSILRSPQTPPSVHEDLWRTLGQGQVWRGELYNRRKDGSEFWCLETISHVVDDEGQTTQYVAVMEDATERKLAEETIHRLAYFDSLTDLPNRRMFMLQAVDQIKHSRRSGLGLAVCYLDLDGFKNVNDTLGHHVGDMMLKEAAQRIKNCLRECDFVGRLGGDEFAALLVDIQSPQAIGVIAQRVIEAMEAPFHIEQHEIFTSTSMGVALFPDDGQDVSDLLRKADMALYQAKEQGKRAYVFFAEDFEARNLLRVDMETLLRGAERRGELRLVYQPKIDTATRRVVGAEALLRWHQPERGLIPPDQFIPIAEETRLIIPIGTWVIREACEQIRRWNEQGITGLKVAVNLSSVQFRAQGLVEEIGQIVRDVGIDPSQLELELTESGLMEAPDKVAQLLAQLRKLGLTLAIDDFGTGYSSLAYLKSFPVSVLKIDRSFVRDIEHDANDAAIVSAIIAMANNLNLTVLGEGIETEAQRRFLLQHGCRYGQGYLFSKPLAAEQLRQLLLSGSVVPLASDNAGSGPG